MKRRTVKLFTLCSFIFFLLFSITNGFSSGSKESAAQDEGSGGTKVVDIKLLSNAFQQGGWQDNDNALIHYLNDKFNINLSVQWIPFENKQEQLQVLAATNDLPDTYTVESDVFTKWQKEDVFMDMMPYLDDYSNLKSEFPERMWALLNPADKRFGIPSWNLENPFGLAIRKDWLDNLGLDLPSPETFTLDKFYSIAKAFALNDPNRSGKNDTVGFSVTPFSNGQFLWGEHIMAAFDLAQPWMEIDGALVPVQVQSERLKEFLAFMKKAYQEGVLDKDFVTHDWSVPQEQIKNGILGIQQVRATPHFQKYTAQLQEITPEAELVYIDPPKGKNGGQALRTMGAGDGKIVINARSDKDVQMRLLQLFDWWVTDDGKDIMKNGIEGVHYEKTGEGEFVPTKWEEDRIRLLYAWFFSGVDPLFNMPKWADLDIAEFAKEKYEDFSEFAWPNDALGIVDQSPAAVDDLENLNVEYMTTMLKIIVGDLPISDIDKAITTWRDNGGDQIINEVNDLYKQFK